jgi:hypothetical protein
MVQDATIGDIRDIRSGESEPAPDKFYLSATAGGLSQFGDDPLGKIDFARASAINTATFKEKGGKYKREFELKKLFLRYVTKYARKWKAMENYPKQIKQKPAWFDIALSMFKENEISTSDKKRINEVFNALWEYRDRLLPERVMSEEESVRQYGIKSPYYEQTESLGSPMQQDQVTSEEILADKSYDIQSPQSPVEIYSGESQQIQSVEPETTLGVRKINPSGGDSFLSGYISPIRSSGLPTAGVKSTVRPPQGSFTMGVTQPQKELGGSGKGAFSIGKNMLSGIRGGEGIVYQHKPNLPSQPVATQESVVQSPVMAQRKQKKVTSLVNRKVSNGLAKFRIIELPTIPKQKMQMRPIKKSKSIRELKTSGKYSIDVGSMNKGALGNMNIDVRNNVKNVVGGIRSLKKKVRGEIKGSSNINSLNINNIKSNKHKNHKDLDILKKLKSDTHSQISREALECKMIPKLKAQCDKVFTKNHLTHEVSKFRDEFKDISKSVPTVKGDKAKIKEIAMLGRSINHGVDGTQVDGVRLMYKNSGTTKQMNIGKMEYDYSFITGKKKPVKDVEEYYEDE